MTLHPDNEYHRFGSARFANEQEIARAGMFQKTKDALFLGFYKGRPLNHSGMGGLVTCAGARSGKLRDILGYSVCHGGFDGTLVVLDPKGEMAAISRHLRKPAYYWNPRRLHGLPYARINPVDYMRLDSPSLISDAKVYCENMIPYSGSSNARYFENRARTFLEGIALTLVRLDGALTLPRLYWAINLIPGGGDAWLDFAFEMSEAGFPVSVSVEEEIAAAQRNSDGNAGGFRGILGELFNAFAALSDPLLMASVSPPYDLSLADLTGDEACQLYLMPDAESLDIWGPVLKSFFVGAMVYKSRAPSAPRQTWIMDELALLGRFPLAMKLFTYGAGIGIRPWAIYQSAEQMKATGPGADTIIPSSAAVRQYFAVRDDVSARRLSEQIGAQSLEYNHVPEQARACLAREEAVRAVLSGDDPVSAALSLSHHDKLARHRSQQHRWLRTPDEIMGMPADRQFIFADGLSHSIYAERAPYFEQRFMAGRFHPNPFHPPLDRVRVKTRFGHVWRAVTQERVPALYAHLPQYRDGWWSIVKGTL